MSNPVLQLRVPEDTLARIDVIDQVAVVLAAVASMKGRPLRGATTGTAVPGDAYLGPR